MAKKSRMVSTVPKCDLSEIIDPHAFVAAGVACYALSLLDNLGFVDKFLKNGSISQQDILPFPNRLVLKSALVTLEKNGIIMGENDSYFLTNFGNQLVDQRGVIGLIYSGYCRVLAHQTKYALDESHPIKDQVDWAAVANASIHFGENTIDPIAIQLMQTLDIKGAICDLGCGGGTRLIKICHLLNTSGIGMECSEEAVKLAREKIKKTDRISIKKADISQIKDIWPEVEVLMQFFVMHDITPDMKCRKVLSSYMKKFPNLKYFLYADIVAPSATMPTQLAGYDYIHSLLGTPTRTYEETLEMFHQASYKVGREIPIPQLPNTFLWLLSPNKLKEEKKCSHLPYKVQL